MKKWYQSKTIWINLLTLAAGLLVVVSNEQWIMNDYSGYVLGVIGFVNCALRFTTNEGVE